MSGEAAPTSARDQPIGELLKQLSQQTSTLVRQEVDLAKAELTDKAKESAIGAGMLGAAGLVAVLALGALTAMFVLVLALLMTPWLAALLVTIAYVAIAAGLGLMGRARLRRSAPPIPQQTIETVKEDVEWAKTRARSARR
jgi:uncharacterized membrane protein YqjE